MPGNPGRDLRLGREAGRRGATGGSPWSLRGGNRWSALNLGQRARVDRELRGVEHLDARVLLPVERRHDRRRRAGLAAKLERGLRVVEPKPQVVLVRRGERDGAAGGHREGLRVKDALYGGAPVALVVGVDIGL